MTAEQYRQAGVAFLGVDVRDTTASAEAFTRNFGITYPSVSDSGSEITLDFTAVVPIAGTPTTLVIDRTGHIAGAVFGPATYEELTAILAKVAGKAAVPMTDVRAPGGGFDPPTPDRQDGPPAGPTASLAAG